MYSDKIHSTFCLYLRTKEFRCLKPTSLNYKKIKTKSWPTNLNKIAEFHEFFFQFMNKRNLTRVDRASMHNRTCTHFHE